MRKFKLVTVGNAAQLKDRDQIQRLIDLADALIVLAGSPSKAFTILQRLNPKTSQAYLENGKYARWKARIVEEEIIRQAKTSGDYYKKARR